MSDAPSFPSKAPEAKAPKSNFVDDIVEEKRPEVIEDDRPVSLSSLPGIVLVRFTASVSPYTSGDVAGVAKDYAIAALRKGWCELHNAGRGKGVVVPRPKGNDDSMQRGARLFQRGDRAEGGVSATEISDLRKENTDLRQRLADLETVVSRLTEAPIEPPAPPSPPPKTPKS